MVVKTNPTVAASALLYGDGNSTGAKSVPPKNHPTNRPNQGMFAPTVTIACPKFNVPTKRPATLARP